MILLCILVAWNTYLSSGSCINIYECRSLPTWLTIITQGMFLFKHLPAL
jgi:hypothetical protein